MTLTSADPTEGVFGSRAVIDDLPQEYKEILTFPKVRHILAYSRLFMREETKSAPATA